MMIGGGKWSRQEDKKTLTSNDIRGGAGYKAVKRENEDVIGLNGVDTKSLSLLSLLGVNRRLYLSQGGERDLFIIIRRNRHHWGLTDELKIGLVSMHCNGVDTKGLLLEVQR